MARSLDNFLEKPFYKILESEKNSEMLEEHSQSNSICGKQKQFVIKILAEYLFYTEEHFM